MKISPVAQGASTPTLPTETPTAQTDRAQRAKAAFLGQARVEESDTPVDSLVTAAKNNIRKIKMRTNVSPDRPFETEVPSDIVPTENVQTTDMPDSRVPDTNSDAEPVTEVTKPLSPQFAALARQKRALQLKEREIADRERALQSQSQSNEGGDVIARLKSNPLAVLQEAGVTYDQLTEAILSNPSNPDVQAIREELKAAKEEFNKTLTDRDTQFRRQALNQIKADTNTLVAQGDDFEMIRETGSQSDVVNLIDRVEKTEGIVMDVQEAAILVENELLKEAEKIARIKKLQSRLVPAESQPVNQVQQNQAPQMRTLTNRDNAKPILSRRDRAIAAALGQLKR